MENTDIHEVLNVLLSVAALLLVLAAAAVSFAKRLWLGAVGFVLMAVTGTYWLTVFQLPMAIHGEVMFTVNPWVGHFLRMVDLAGWLLLVIQLVVIPRGRASI